MICEIRSTTIYCVGEISLEKHFLIQKTLFSTKNAKISENFGNEELFGSVLKQKFSKQAAMV